MGRLEEPRPPPPPAPATHMGALLREWRAARRLSQLALALEAGVSPRHLSYVETGKAQPSRDLVMRLADALEMPLRERNTLLMAAGYAPKYAETELETPVMAQVRRAIELILNKQEPYPAFLLDRHWNVVMTNRAAARIDEFLLPDHSCASSAPFPPTKRPPSFVEPSQAAVRNRSDLFTRPRTARSRSCLNQLNPGGSRSWWREAIAESTSGLSHVGGGRRHDVESVDTGGELRDAAGSPCDPCVCSGILYFTEYLM